MGCRRKIDSFELAEDFVLKVMDAKDDLYTVVNKIAEAEMTLYQLEMRPTLTHTDYRVEPYRSSKKRERLHDQILKELFQQERLADDDEITLGKGGAKPKETKFEKEAYIVTGPPASGKSGIAARIADECGAYILDSDYAKRKFPEYQLLQGGASLVNAESSSIIFGPHKSLLVQCIYNGSNIVIPMVGKTYSSVDEILKTLILAEYRIHIINVVLDRYKCVSRAYSRFIKTKRYVPLSYIFDEVGNEPERVYFLIKRAYFNHSSFAHFVQISTDVYPGKPVKICEIYDKNHV